MIDLRQGARLILISGVGFTPRYLWMWPSSLGWGISSIVPGSWIWLELVFHQIVVVDIAEAGKQDK